MIWGPGPYFWKQKCSWIHLDWPGPHSDQKHYCCYRAWALVLRLRQLEQRHWILVLNWPKIMAVCYTSACMGCQGCPSSGYSLTLQAASAHYTRSPLWFQSQISLMVGIATAILPNRPSDAEKGDIQETAQEWSSARHWRSIWIHMQWFTCLNYTCNSEIRAYEFINSKNSYTTEFRGLWIHILMNS